MLEPPVCCHGRLQPRRQADLARVCRSLLAGQRMLVLLGDHRQALRYCGQAVDLLHDLGNREGEASTLDSLGYTHQQLGNHAESVACYQRAIDLYGEIGHRWGVAETLGRLGDAHQAGGDLGKARTAGEDALAILDDLHHPEAARIRTKLSEL